MIFNVHSSATTQGFTENEDEFDLSDYPDVAKVEDAYPNCVVMPLSKLTVNETGVNNGDITSFSASLFVRKRNGQVAYLLCCRRGREGGGGVAKTGSA